MSAVTPVPAPSQAVLSACRDLIFEALVHVCDRAASYARSASEAAWRGDESTVNAHAGQLTDIGQDKLDDGSPRSDSERKAREKAQPLQGLQGRHAA